LIAACSTDESPTTASIAPTDAGGSSLAGATAPVSRPRPADCPTGGGISTISIASVALGHPVRVSIISEVPAADVVAVVYLLHGANTDETQWDDIGVRSAVNNVAAPRIAAVLPDLPNSYDTALDSAALINDILPAVEMCLGGNRPRSDRAIGGISRGGQLALTLAAAHPELFTAVGGHSPVIAPDTEAQLAHDLAASGAHVRLDVGTDDSLRPSTVDLAQTLTNLGAPAELHVTPGRHDRHYWAAHVDEYLTWYAEHLAA
jgi:enterochelin esterase-like enzyme